MAALRVADLSAGRTSWPQAFVADVLDAVGQHDSFAQLLACYPVARLNPFQRLLYQAAEPAGFRVLPLARLDGVDHVGWAGRIVLHLHWLGALLRACETDEQAMQAVREVDRRLASCRKRGYRIVWTVHNILPHSFRYEAAEIALRKVVAKRAHLIHVMCANTADEAQQHYRLPADKLFHLPHPSYEGWYPAIVGKSEARAEFGLGAREFVFLFFGSIQPYKGLLALVEAFEALCLAAPGVRLRLLIAGKPADPDYCRVVADRVAGHKGIVFRPLTIEDAQVQEFFAASDVVVAPYLATLNSGVALLAATFRRLVVAPRQGAMAEVFAGDDALLYDPDSERGLYDAMRKALVHQVDGASLDGLLMRHRPRQISTVFFARLRERLDLAEYSRDGA